VLDRFLLVLSDLQLCKDIKFLASSRYSLFVVDITTAKNYHSNQIDNTCCQNWTIPNVITAEYIYDYLNPVQVTELISTDSVTDWNVDKEKNWLQILCFWLKLLAHIKKHHSWSQIHNFIDKIHGSNEWLRQDTCWYGLLANFEKKIMRILYLCTDSIDACEKIQQLIKHDDVIFDFYQKWSQVVGKAIT
jgi:hypothetical protein